MDFHVWEPVSLLFLLQKAYVEFTLLILVYLLFHHDK